MGSNQSFLDKEKCMALVVGEDLVKGKEINYIGTLTIKKHKLRKDLKYALTDKGPVFRGRFIKRGLAILKKKRVWLFLTGLNDNNSILFLGSKEGTIAIAPILAPDLEFPVTDDKTRMLTDFTKETARFKRKVLFNTLLRK